MADIVIYDTEGTDVDPRHAQVTQFGGVRTDLAFNPVEEVNLKVRRLPWVVPAPKALEVTGISHPSELDAPGRLSEYEASGLVERFLVPGYGVPRTMVTFNGIQFDDELIRTMFFRNLRNPWFASGKLTTRIDLLDVVRLAAAGAPGCIEVPVEKGGKPSWKLDRLCPANGIHIHAHDALGDSLATLELAKAVKDRAGWAWDAASAAGRRPKLESLLQQAASDGRVMYLFRHFGSPEVVPCVVLGTDGQRKWILADLRKDGVPTDREGISDLLFTQSTPYPVVRATAAPLFVEAARAMDIDPTIDPSRIEAKAKTFKGGDAAREAVAALKGRGYQPVEAPTSEELIYGGFVPDRDKPKMTEFHRAQTWEERAAVSFADTRLRDFAARIVLEASSYGECSLPQETVAACETACGQALSRPSAPADSRWMTVAKAAAEGATSEWLEWAERAFPATPAHGAESGPAQIEFGL